MSLLLTAEEITNLYLKINDTDPIDLSPLRQYQNESLGER